MCTTSARPQHTFTRFLQNLTPEVCIKAAYPSQIEKRSCKPSPRFVQKKDTFSVHCQCIDRCFFRKDSSASLPLSSTPQRDGAGAPGRELERADILSCRGVAIAPYVLGANTPLPVESPIAMVHGFGRTVQQERAHNDSADHPDRIHLLWLCSPPAGLASQIFCHHTRKNVGRCSKEQRKRQITCFC